MEEFMNHVKNLIAWVISISPLNLKLPPLGNWAFSGTLLLGIPSGKAVAGVDGSYQTGDGEFNQQLQFNFGRSYRIAKQDFYLKTYVGYNNRSGGFSDELHSFAETGTQLWNKKLLILSRLHWIKPMYNGTLDASNSNGAIFANNIESFALGGEVALNLGKHWGISVATATPLFGKVIYRGNSYSGGLFLNY